MNPYEPEKVSKANELYSEVLTTNAQDDGKLKELRLRAREELGVKFSTELLYEKLTAACNPKNFTGEAYNKERLELANRLYQAVLMNADNVFALEGQAIDKRRNNIHWQYHSQQRAVSETIGCVGMGHAGNTRREWHVWLQMEIG